ncbi:hypothetical protein ACFTZB_16040 [Rhodococcus sp. NPDC057014]|uniref:hypothetical protein n=1 Tax=Rhodococcus sp. NPDC057014 TaxID=3346000 RepID=UPI00362A4C3F
MSDLVCTDDNSAEPESELAVVVEPEGLLVAGDQSSVQMFLDKLTFNAVGAIEVAGVDSQALAGTAALAAGLAASASHHAPMEARHDHRQLNKR